MINPFLSLILSVKNYFSDYSKNIVWLFCGFYGFTFYPAKASMDSFRHREDFLSWYMKNDLSLNEFFDKLYGNSRLLDVFLPLLKYGISRFTDNANVFYGILGLLFGYFFSRNIWFLLNYAKRKLNKYEILSICIFAVTIAPWEINSFRFWMGAHVFVYYITKVLLLKKNKYIIGMATAPFIHFGLFVALLFYFVYRIAGNRLRIYVYMLFVSIFFNAISASQVQALIPKTSITQLDKKSDSYTSDEYIEGRESTATNLNWYVTLKSKPLYFITIFIILFLYHKKRKELLKSPYLSYLCFTIFFMAVSYMLMNAVPTFYRYFRMTLLMFYGFLFLFFLSENSKWYKNIYKFHLIAALFFSIIEIRIWFDSATVDTLVSNPVVSMLYQTYQPVINVIK